MTKLNFHEMSREELRAYILEHRDDEVAFHAYMDRLATLPALVHGTPQDAQDPVRFAELLEQVRRLKQERKDQDS